MGRASVYKDYSMVHKHEGVGEELNNFRGALLRLHPQFEELDKKHFAVPGPLVSSVVAVCG